MESLMVIGKGVYQFEEKTGVTDESINVHYYRPTTWTPGDVIAFVLHGTNRDAERYLNDWTSYASKNNVLVVCPEFSEEKYPGSRYYNIGNVMSSTNGNGILQNKEDWVFPVINRIMADLKLKTDSSESITLLYGHSAGAQMVHRYVLFDGNTDFDLIISANASWYTMPDDKILFPYGIANVPLNEKDLETAFKKSVVILLGENDTIRDSNLRVTEEADNQGTNRLERGKNFYEQMKNKAEELGVPFNWKLSLVSGVGHNDYLMAKSAVEIFLDTVADIESKIVKLTESDNTLKTAVDGATIQALGGNDTLRSYGDDVLIDSGAGNDSIRNYGDNVSINAGKSNDIIRNYGDDVTITGGTGNDTIRNAFGENVLFKYSSGDGNDVITGFNESSTLKIGDGTATYSTVKSGNNIIVTAGSGKLTLQGAATLDTLNILGKDSSVLTLTNSSKAAVTLSITYKSANASKRTAAIKITGNSLDNSIVGSSKNDTLYGKDGNDYLNGGNGVDKLYGGNGA